ncbi:hypothetical protein [Mycobacterium neumannii]|uniref:hypothetical protein n=1 Tax=Mycobacterium neumannii TaxID=2048551 RepID=UPI000F843E2D|nr:hypothetical protein [Mycobacterium neumannii]
MADDVTDLVGSAGGWLYDRVMAGWDVTVILSAQEDVRPIQILGAKFMDLRGALTGPPRQPAAIAIPAALYRRELSAREAVHAAVGRRVEVTLWGQNCPRELSRLLTDTIHELSWAARIFKTRALAAAAGSAEFAPPKEVFRTVTRNRRSMGVLFRNSLC